VCDSCRIPVAHLPLVSIGSRGLVFSGEVCVCRRRPPMVDWDGEGFFCSPPSARAQGAAFSPRAEAPAIDGMGGGDRVSHPGAEWCGPECGGECLLLMLNRAAIRHQEANAEMDASVEEEGEEGEETPNPEEL
jgi:hypothetical protein